MSDKNRGLYDKYRVHRHGDTEGKHADCQYFVLDLTHDRHSRAAIMAYAGSCYLEYPRLSADLLRLLNEFEVPG